jgi:hypothetical protein
MVRAMRRRVNLKTTGRILVTVLLLAVLVWVVDVREAGRILLQANPVLLALGIAVGLGDRVFMAMKWLPLLRAQSVAADAAAVVKAYLAASFAGIFLPASVGADILRTIALGRSGSVMAEVGASILVERLLGLIGSAILGVVALAVALNFSLDVSFILPWAAIAVSAPVAVVVLPQLPRVRALLDRWTDARDGSAGIAAFVRRFGAAYLAYRDHGRTLILVGILSILEQFVPIALLWLMAAALGIGVTLPMLVVSVPLALFVNRLPIAFSSFGIMEGALVYLLGLFGVGSEEALALSLGGRVAELAAAVPGAFFWSVLVADVPAPEAAEEEPTID